MKKTLFILFVLVRANPLQADVLSVDIPSPEFYLQENGIVAENAQFTTRAGFPKLPCRRITIALPPNALVEFVRFHGPLEEMVQMEVTPCPPFLPLSDPSAKNNIHQSYEQQKIGFSRSADIYPGVRGEVLVSGRFRKYVVVELACYHFAYRASTQTVYHTPSIRADIHYREASCESEAAGSFKDLMNDVTFDDMAREKIFNWEQAKTWYRPVKPRTAKGYTIILPASIQNAVLSLVNYRQSQGYEVQIVTVEYIESTVSGDDLAQKIRNYLRDHLSSIQYVLLVGTIVDLPMREMVPFNNDPDSPFDNWDVSPVPCDFYYAELSSPDNQSWNSDGDDYFGEVYDQNLEPNGEDNPEYFADVHLGRIPYRTESYIEDICQKIIDFDKNTDLSYKTSSLLAGGMIYFENENYAGYPRMDGADMMEQLMNESILDRNRAEYLYDEEGLDATTYACTAPLTRDSMISHWNRKGVVLEYNHGASNAYARKIWSWDDGDGVAESAEMQYPMCLLSEDVYELDNDYPATTFLRSCMCGKPEVDSLGKYLLYRGASSVFCSTRILWASYLEDGVWAITF